MSSVSCGHAELMVSIRYDMIPYDIDKQACVIKHSAIIPHCPTYGICETTYAEMYIKVVET